MKESIQRVSKYTLNEVKGNNEKADELAVAYKELFNERLRLSCDNCIFDALFRIKHYLKQEKDQIMSDLNLTHCDFELRKGLVLYLPDMHMHITNDNLTNEKALLLLHRNIANIKSFSKYPENLQEYMGGKKADGGVDTGGGKDKEEEKEPAAPKMTVDDIIGDNTKSEIIFKLGDYPHDPKSIKAVLAETLIEKLTKEEEDNESNNIEDK